MSIVEDFASIAAGMKQLEDERNGIDRDQLDRFVEYNVLDVRPMVEPEQLAEVVPMMQEIMRQEFASVGSQLVSTPLVKHSERVFTQSRSECGND